MNFLELFEIPSEGKILENMIVTDYEKDILMKMEKKSLDEDQLLKIIEDVLKDYNIEISPKRLLMDMYKRANINKVSEDVYTCSSLYTRLAYFAQYEQDLWKRVPEKIRQDIDKWYVKKYADGALPRLKEIQEGKRELIENAYFYTLDETLELIDSLDKDIYVVPCNCRSIQMTCDKHVNTCMLFEYDINSEYDRGRGKVISKEEAKAIAIKADKNGLMHTSEEAHAICHCCGDCCYPIRASEVIGTRGIWPKRRYDISFNEDKCISCKKCTKICNFDAFVYEDSQIKFDPDKCFGCTICESNCPTEAISIHKIK
ncbi:4Fe-4S dicluster domain-containing protein [Acidaminobacter sp. JC074]|uniref:4Fe-4S binding protein n=1 Tax=Acidaminobacter sp. JC074 TaxID=2530199 RepID=UPI001F10C13E|nr:4Fe-4S binding protein [Acidaminobacter sp. JC074]MCH4887831.1 4Fe-4S dicluster domain-containing protein [Acidaminobacter sp. JC074]